MILEAKKRGEQQFKDYLREQNLSTVEMKLVHGGLAPIGVMIAKKKQQKNLPFLAMIWLQEYDFNSLPKLPSKPHYQRT